MEQVQQEVMTLFSKMMQGDYAHRASGDDPLIRQANSLAHHLEQYMVGQLDDMVSMTMGAFETTMAMGHLEQDMKQLDDRAMSMAAASEQMSANVAHVAERVDQVNQNIVHANTQSQNASSAVNHAVDAMDKINERVGQAGERVQDLQEASQEINSILSVIQKISDQTNLLALNATIEAARAGDVGRGFAVVANEVKELSHQTKQATENIVIKIRRIQEDVVGIAQVTEEISTAVDQGNQDMTDVNGRMDEMSSALNVIADEVDQITQATHDQSDASQEVAVSVAETATMVGGVREVVAKTLNDTDALETKLMSEINEFAEMKLTNAVLRLAKSDHILWKKRLVNMVLDRGDIDISTVADHHGCRLGKWYDTLGQEVYGSSHTFKELLTPHEQVHSLGRKAVERYNSGDREGAIADVEAIKPLSEKVVGLLDRLIQESS